MSKGIHLKIMGMTCEHCVMHVRKALEEVEKVESVDVSLQNASADLSVADDFNSPDALISAVEKAGYSANL